MDSSSVTTSSASSTTLSRSQNARYRLITARAPEADATDSLRSDRNGDTTTLILLIRHRHVRGWVRPTGPPAPNQLWFDDDGRTMRPAGLIGHDGAVVMEGDMGKATGMGITAEPTGGSPQPTTAPLALMTLPA
ncbi:anti-sigma factor [Streptomyces sp. ISL-96]|uniref:anti-sigma factor n=1 Tax=Streptomyces sp. ISL-96 TaxID=2819191 RepID=UPI001BEA2DCC|nr:anti-sigma factor [Streptomyces sp. ISL-96]MBT2487195.1 anti-sigma factor [Streptomyces sp. ISL-96]